MPRTRNRWLALAAPAVALAGLVGGAGSLLRAIDAARQDAAGGYLVGELLKTAAALVGLVGWLQAARAFRGPEIDWRRLRVAGTIVATTLFVGFAAVALELVVVLRSTAGTAYRVSLALSTAGALVLAIAATVAVGAFALGADRSRERGRRLGRAGYIVAVAFSLGAAAAVAFESYYGPYAVPGGLPAGLALETTGGAVFALAAAFAGIALAAAGRNREALLSFAAALGAAGLLAVAAGEASMATTLSRIGYTNLVVAGAWLLIGYRLALVTAMACVLAATRAAAVRT